jgi:hypothetical protein
MSAFAILIGVLAIYGAMSLICGVVHKQSPEKIEHTGQVINVAADRSLGWLPSDLREIDRAQRLALAVASRKSIHN